MPLDLMRALARGPLPTTVDDPDDIDRLRVLAAAHLIEAQLPPVDTPTQPAQVLGLTPEGRAALRMAYPDEHFSFAPRPFAGALPGDAATAIPPPDPGAVRLH